jgi:cell division ATPase FtsA
VRIGGLEQVILCGGGAALSGLAPMARAALGMPVRIAGAWGFAGPAAVQSPAYASVLGLLRWRAMVQSQTAQRERSTVSLAHGASFITTNSAEFAGQPNRIGQTRWQAWLREFLP